MKVILRDVGKKCALEDAGRFGCYKGGVISSSWKRERQCAYAPRVYRLNLCQGRFLVYQEEASRYRWWYYTEAGETVVHLRFARRFPHAYRPMRGAVRWLQHHSCSVGISTCIGQPRGDAGSPRARELLWLQRSRPRNSERERRALGYCLFPPRNNRSTFSSEETV